MRARTREWIIDAAVGGVIGGIAGAIVAVNVVIFSGIEAGYESGLTDVFEYHALLGVVVLLILVGGPVLGVITARRARSIRDRRSH